jgi:hypothetical protein
MIFPSLRGPSERTTPPTNVKRLVNLRRLFQGRPADQKTQPSHDKGQEEVEGSQVQLSVSPSVP